MCTQEQAIFTLCQGKKLHLDVKRNLGITSYKRDMKESEILSGFIKPQVLLIYRVSSNFERVM